ncbi:MAG: DUF4180 domain-containing protein [Oscillospiraceae bacterium]
MNINYIENNGRRVAVLEEPGWVLESVQDALDLMTDVRILGDSDSLILLRENLPEEFYELKTGLAGEILQKYTNYGFRLAIVGNFSDVTSKSLNDFIRESNRGSQVFFLPTVEEATEKLLRL